MFSKLSQFLEKNYIGYPMFWIFNGIYLLIIFFGFFCSSNLLQLTLEREIPWNIAILLYSVIGLLILSIVIGFKTKSPKKLTYYLLGFEIPVLVILIIRIMSMKELTPVMWLLLISVIIGYAGYLLITWEVKPKSNIINMLLFLSQELLVVIGIYIGILIAFLIPYILVTPLLMLFNTTVPEAVDNMINSIIMTKGLIIIPGVFYILLALISIAALINLFAYPYFCIFLYWKNSQEKYNEVKEIYKPVIVERISYAFIILFIVIASILSYQDNNMEYESKIVRINEQNNFEERQPYIKKLMSNENGLKSTMVKVYLASYRYAFDKNNKLIYNLYKELGLPVEIAELAQNIFNSLAIPFIFNGELYNTEENTESYYKEVFDTDIEYAERAAIVKAKEAGNIREAERASITDIDRKTVELVSRKVNVKSIANSPFAIVSIEEEYKNNTYRLQEVYYEFNLPEDSVVTSLKLGPNLEFEGVVSTKGAARRVYEEQLTARKDPALLEKAGPRQYRLRVYPIPVKGTRVFTSGEANQKIKYEYITNKSKNGIALPEITQRRNIFNYQGTKINYSLNGKNLTDVKNKEVSSIKVDRDDLIKGPAEITEVNGQYIYFIPENLNIKKILKAVNNKKIAVLIDVSYSTRELNWYKYVMESNIFKDLTGLNKIDLYYFNYELSNSIRITNIDRLKDINTITKYGKTDRLSAIYSIPKEYDLAIMLTDGSEFDEYEGKDRLPGLKFPVYIVHADNKIPAYSDTLATELIKDGGNTVSSIIDALTDYGLSKTKSPNIPDNVKILGARSYGVWVLAGDKISGIRTLKMPKGEISSVLHAMAAEKLIKTMLRERDIEDNRELDKIHAIAEKYGVVTQYSSLIALVNSWQMEQLRYEERQEDRYTFGSKEKDIRANIQFSNPLNMFLSPINQPISKIGSVLKGVNDVATSPGPASTSIDPNLHTNTGLSTMATRVGDRNQSVGMEYVVPAGDSGIKGTYLIDSQQEEFNRQDFTYKDYRNKNVAINAGTVEQEENYGSYIAWILLLIGVLVLVIVNRNKIKELIKGKEAE